MLAALRQRLDREDDGFTLIELMVVVLIIAILIAIAIPTFLGVQNRAKDRAAQSDLRNALTAAKTLATDNSGDFLDATGGTLEAVDLEGVEASLTWIDGASTDNDEIGVAAAADGSAITLSRLSATDTMFAVKALADGTVTYCQGADATTAAADVTAACADPEW